MSTRILIDSETEVRVIQSELHADTKGTSLEYLGHDSAAFRILIWSQAYKAHVGH